MKEAKILMVGLDGAGKTTILYKLKNGEVMKTIPTIGYNNESVEHKNINFHINDVGGLITIRPLWRHQSQNSQGLIFVVDSSDRERISEAREELMNLLEQDELKNVPTLVYANKQDLPNAMTVTEISDKLGFVNLKNKTCYAQATWGTNGSGLYEGLDWLAEELKKRH